MNDAMPQFDRRVEDLGNIVELGHVNVTVPDQRLATIFYISGLGLTRDPYLMSGVDNMWANVGRAQFHLPSRDTTRPGQVVRGTTGLVRGVQESGKQLDAPVTFALEEAVAVVTKGIGSSVPGVADAAVELARELRKLPCVIQPSSPP